MFKAYILHSSLTFLPKNLLFPFKNRILLLGAVEYIIVYILLEKYLLYKMPKEPKNHGKQWSEKDIEKLEKLADGNTPTGLIAYQLGRTEDAVRSKASDEEISLHPTNKSPYNRRK